MNLIGSMIATKTTAQIQFYHSSTPERALLVGENTDLVSQLQLRQIECEIKIVAQENLWESLDEPLTQYACVILTLNNHSENIVLCRQLRECFDTSELPIIIFVADHQAAIEAIKAGASDFCFFTNAVGELPARIWQCLLNHQHAQRIALQLDEQKRAIAQSQLLTEKIVDALPVSLYVVDRDLRIVAWNRNREVGGQGIQRQQVIGRSALDVFSKMPCQRLIEEFEKVFASQEPLRFEQESKADGQTRHWLISKIPMRLDETNNDVTHVITLGEEITEQKKMNAAIIHTEKLAGIGKLASGVVHEINNPLATIAACTEALQLRLDELAAISPETQADFKEYLKLVHDETFRCKTITNNLLEFSRHRESEKTRLEVNYLIEHTLRLVKHHPKLKRLQLGIELSEISQPINANEAQIKQVFIALITNACDAVDEVTGQLHLQTLPTQINGKDFISIEFTDNGLGIPPEMQATIFEPFVTTKPFGQGTGLGLAVCYGIISDHGGKIEVQSQVGSGTTMRVLLPAVS